MELILGTMMMKMNNIMWTKMEIKYPTSNIITRTQYNHAMINSMVFNPQPK